MAKELDKDQKRHLTELLFQRLIDSAAFRMGVAISLAGNFTLKQYEEYLKEVQDGIYLLPEI